MTNFLYFLITVFYIIPSLLCLGLIPVFSFSWGDHVQKGAGFYLGIFVAALAIAAIPGVNLAVACVMSFILLASLYS